MQISCEKEVFSGLVENDITEFTKVFVTTNPEGYKLYIDNRYMNLTSPDSIQFVSEGIHKLTLKHDIFSDSSMNINVTKSSNLALNVDMMKNPRFFGKIFCYTNPQGAKILLNDVPTNLITPVTLSNVYPGEFEIKFVKDQHRDDSLTMKINGGQSSQIYRILEDTSRTVNYKTNNSNITSDVLCKVVVDKNNNKWVGSIDHGLIKFDGKRWTSYENNGVITGSLVQDLLVDKRGWLWVGTTRSLTVFDGINWQSYTDKLPSEVVTALEEDVYGNIWIATSGGLVKYQNNIFYDYTDTSPRYPLLNLTALASTKSGQLWVGTSLSGLLFFNGSQWSRYLTSDIGLSLESIPDIVKDLIIDKKGNLWSYHSADPALGARSALIQYDGSLWKELDLHILYNLKLNSFYVDTENNIWMSIEGGLLRYNDSKPLKVLDSNTYGVASKSCTSFAIDQNGDGWLTTLGGGIAKLKKGTFEN